MKKTIKYIDGDKVTITSNSNLDLDDDLPLEVDFSNAKPFHNSKLAKKLSSKKKVLIELEPDISCFFKNSKQVNNYLRNQINLIQKTISI